MIGPSRVKLLVMTLVLIVLLLGVTKSFVEPIPTTATHRNPVLTLDDPNPQAGAQFGLLVAGVGDVNGDGRPDIAVGVPLQHVGSNANQGQGFVFSGATGALLHIHNCPVPQAGALFGSGTTGIGDVDGDGRPDIAVGAHGLDLAGQVNQGAAFIFSGATGALLRTLNSPAPPSGAQFGQFIAWVGDVDGDGRPDVAITAAFQTVAGNALQGQVFLFSGATGTLIRTLDSPIPAALAEFGSSVAGVGDVDGDGRPDIAVGARFLPSFNDFGPGKVFVLSGTTGALLYTLDNPTPPSWR